MTELFSNQPELFNPCYAPLGTDTVDHTKACYYQRPSQVVVPKDHAHWSYSTGTTVDPSASTSKVIVERSPERPVTISPGVTPNDVGKVDVEAELDDLLGSAPEQPEHKQL